MFTRKEEETDSNAYMQQRTPSYSPASGTSQEPVVSTGKETNVIARGTVIRGDVQSEGDLRIDGEVKGTIRSRSKVIVGQDGFVDGDVECVHAEVLGRVKGSLTVQDHLNLRGNAKMEGDVLTTHLEMEPSVKFNGKCTMQDKVELSSLTKAREEKPAAAAPASIFKNTTTDKANGAKEEKPTNGVAQKQAI